MLVCANLNRGYLLMKYSNFYHVILLTSSILFFGCSDPENQKKDRPVESQNDSVLATSEAEALNLQKIEFERSATYATTDEIIVAEVSDIAVDEKERVFIKDDGQSSIHVFNEGGSYLTSIGREGRGRASFHPSLEIQK